MRKWKCPKETIRGTKDKLEISTMLKRMRKERLPGSSWRGELLPSRLSQWRILSPIGNDNCGMYDHSTLSLKIKSRSFNFLVDWEVIVCLACALVLTDPWDALLIILNLATSNSFLSTFSRSTRVSLNLSSILDSQLLDRFQLSYLFFAFFLLFLSISTLARLDSWMSDFYCFLKQCCLSFSFILFYRYYWISWMSRALYFSI